MGTPLKIVSPEEHVEEKIEVELSKVEAKLILEILNNVALTGREAQRIALALGDKIGNALSK